MPGTICLLPQELARNTHTRTHTKHIHTLRLQMTMHTAKEKQHTCTTTNLMPIATRPRNLQQCLETQLYAKHNHWPPFANYWHSIATQQCIILPMRECVPTARLQHDTLQCTTTLDNQYTPLGAHAGLTGHRRARRVVLATVSLHMARARTCKEGSKVPAASCCEPGTILNSRRARGDSEVLWFTTRLQTQPPKSPPSISTSSEDKAEKPYIQANITERQDQETICMLTSSHRRTKSKTTQRAPTCRNRHPFRRGMQEDWIQQDISAAMISGNSRSAHLVRPCPNRQECTQTSRMQITN